DRRCCTSGGRPRASSIPPRAGTAGRTRPAGLLRIDARPGNPLPAAGTRGRVPHGVMTMAVEIAFEPTKTSAAAAPVLLRMTAIRKAFGGQVVLDDISADVAAGEVIILRGANGSGKTTLLNILSGSLAADEGQITIA